MGTLGAKQRKWEVWSLPPVRRSMRTLGCEGGSRTQIDNPRVRKPGGLKGGKGTDAVGENA